jgi:hypothetical protein
MRARFADEYRSAQLRDKRAWRRQKVAESETMAPPLPCGRRPAKKARRPQRAGPRADGGARMA